MEYNIKGKKILTTQYFIHAWNVVWVSLVNDNSLPRRRHSVLKRKGVIIAY